MEPGAIPSSHVVPLTKRRVNCNMNVSALPTYTDIVSKYDCQTVLTHVSKPRPNFVPPKHAGHLFCRIRSQLPEASLGGALSLAVSDLCTVSAYRVVEPAVESGLDGTTSIWLLCRLSRVLTRAAALCGHRKGRVSTMIGRRTRRLGVDLRVIIGAT